MCKLKISVACVCLIVQITIHKNTLDEFAYLKKIKKKVEISLKVIQLVLVFKNQ